MHHAAPALAVADLTVQFGGVRAVDGVSFDVPACSIISLIGPNGAGKTTVLNSISGFVDATGSIRYGGRDLLRESAHRRAGLGIGRTFQNLQLFTGMTVLENVLVGAHARIGGNVVFDLLRVPVIVRERRARERAREILRDVGIERYAGRLVEGLPFGIQKLTGVARAIAAEPKLLLLDEPAAGLTRAEAETLGSVISRLRSDFNLAVLLVEHNMRLVMAISDRVVVLDEGRTLTEGTPDQVGRDPAVVEAYLGAVDDAAVVEVVRDELAGRQ